MWAIPAGISSIKKKIRSRVPVLSLASRKPVRIRQSGRTGIRGVTQPSIKGVFARKEAGWRADMAIGRFFFYDACIPTNVVNSFYFKPIFDAISSISPRYKGPTYYQL